MSSEVQLFATTGVLAATVSIPWDAEIVVWNHKYYALRDGRYVECKCVTGYLNLPNSAASPVGFNVRR